MKDTQSIYLDPPRLSFVRPLGMKIPLYDDGALQAYETALDAQERQVFLRAMKQPPHDLPPRWKKAAAWLGMILFCALASAGIVWGVRALGEWITRRF